MKRRLMALAIWAGIACSSLSVVVALGTQSASAIDLFGGVCKGAGKTSAACGASGQDNLSGSDGVILRAATLIAIIAGITAVIMILIGGFMFITAAGDSSRVSTARKTIIYAAVGLVVIALARTIVSFVITRV